MELMSQLRSPAFLLTLVGTFMGCSALFDYGPDETTGTEPLPGVGGAGLGPGAGGGGGQQLPRCESDVECADASSCTEDRCTDGTCSNSALDDGVVCESGGGEAGLCEEGVCVVACTGDDATVCDDDNPCTVDGCNTELGQCENAPVPDGPLEDLQVVGDCQSVTCSAGVETIVDDDSDVFDDGNACTDDICTDGAPENPNRPEGSSCGGSLVCNDNGVCVGCVQPSDCPGSDDFCQAITCNAGQCGVSNTSAGTPLPAGQQTAGECRQRQCDGNGSIQVVNRPASTACNDGIYCNGPDSCLSGNCSQHGPPPCSGGGCNSACNESAQNCTANATNGSPCDDGNPCTTTDSCNGTGTCVGTGNPCAGNVADNDSNCQEACNPATGQCNAAEPAGTACNDGNNCTMTDTCNSSGSCVGTGDPCAGSVGDNDNNCQEACNPATGQCTAAEPTGTACNDGQFCTDTDTCNSSGTCVGTGNPCGTSVCQVCNDSTNTCQNAPNGTPCLGGMDPDPCFVCATGMCMFDPNADPSCLN